MASKNSSVSLASGLGMAMTFLGHLEKSVLEKGGFLEMLHQLSVPTLSDQARSTIDQIADFVVRSKWKIPRSLIERLVVENRDKLASWDKVEKDRRFNWYTIKLEERFGIPVATYSADPTGWGYPAIPTKIIESLESQDVTYPMIVEYEGEQHVVVKLGATTKWELGERPEGPYDLIGFAPAKYFDLER